ncbi:YkgJ family cysteine cluster protein [bacterium 1xD8-48]|jgi:Fe-S-cluster containining protein|nr:YkgJ family cysteine cluster protein [Lachnospiraceae bacterium]NBJ99118.1 YkgJ family cysteine cluster protein [bacterium 1xD8-48]
MEREVDLKEISDGRLYGINDMVKAGCNDCAGCSLCCEGMGNSIILDPYDIFMLEKGCGLSFEELLAEKLELNVVDYIIQPNLKMQGKGGRCGFLNEKGRCSIHPYRPGFCRMFPLGRIYEDKGFRYFLQIHECPFPGKTKVKLKRWLDIPEIGRYERYVCDWHFFLKDMQKIIRDTENEEITRNLNLYLLNQFYVQAYEVSGADRKEADFYGQFYRRLGEAVKRAALYA